MSLDKRLKAARLFAGISQEELALRVGVSQSLITKIERGLQETTSLTVKLAMALGVNVIWLDDGSGSMIPEYTARQETAPYNVLPISKPLSRVPLLSWVQAGQFVDSNTQDNEATECITTEAKVDVGCYALRVKGDSMSPRFAEGTILIVNPQLEAVANDFVIARNGDNEATFKQLIKDGGDWYLKPLNEQYPLKPIGHNNIVGVVIQAQMVDKLK